MTAILRAPELSATSRIERIWIMRSSCQGRRPKAEGRNPKPSYDFGFLHNACDDPALPAAQRPRGHERHAIADARFVLLVVGHEPRRQALLLAVDAVPDLALDGNDHALVHLVADDRPEYLDLRHRFSSVPQSSVRDALFAQDGLHPRALAPQRADLVGRLHLPHRFLDSQTTHLLVQLARAMLQVVDRQPAQFRQLLADLHDTRSSAKRAANRVFIGSLAAASRIAARASSAVTPSISKRIRPGLITATQPSGAPLPLPMRVSCGFLVMGLSGNTRIQTLPPRLMPRVSATRAASICRSVSQHGSSDISP